MINTNLLKFKIAENNRSQKYVAEKLGISLQCFNRKLNNAPNDHFRLNQVETIRKILNLSDEEVVRIFLYNKSTL